MALISVSQLDMLMAGEQPLSVEVIHSQTGDVMATGILTGVTKTGMIDIYDPESDQELTYNLDYINLTIHF
jgi:hypothetical protein